MPHVAGWGVLPWYVCMVHRGSNTLSLTRAMDDRTKHSDCRIVSSYQSAASSEIEKVLLLGLSLVLTHV